MRPEGAITAYYTWLSGVFEESLSPTSSMPPMLKLFDVNAA
jgi:hypothetical protein